MLKIEHLTKKYDQFKAVDDLSLHIEGEIIIDGKSMKTHALECKKIMAYIPDNPDLYEYLTGIQYLNFIADVYQVSKEEREKRISQYGDMFDLTYINHN